MSEPIPYSHIQVAAGQDEFLRLAANRIIDAAREALGERGRATIALSGGSTPRPVYELLTQPPYSRAMPWPHVRWFFGDERAVGPEHEHSNYRMAREALFAPARVPARNIHRIEGELGVVDASANYSSLLSSFFPQGNIPVFDLILLGLGTDGHTASLFPGRNIDGGAVLAVPAPDMAPRVDRVSLSLPCINAARRVLFLVQGSGKAELVANILAGAPEAARLPAAQVCPAGGAQWLLDAEAAAGLG